VQEKKRKMFNSFFNSLSNRINRASKYHEGAKQVDRYLKNNKYFPKHKLLEPAYEEEIEEIVMENGEVFSNITKRMI